MIGRAHRFHGYGSLRYVYKNGKTVRGPLTTLKFTVNDRRDSYRLAVVVSKKVHKSAVVRNRIRRRVYEAFRRLAAEDQGYDLVLTVFSERVATMAAGELDTVVREQLSQIGAGLLKK